MKKTKRKFYRNGNGFLMVTGECPKGFKDYMFVVWEGEIDNLREGVRTLDQLQKLEEVDEVDWEWYAAFAEAAGFDPEPPEKPKHKEAARNPARRDAPLDEFLGHCAAGTDMITAAAVSGLMDSPPKDEDEPAIQVDPTFHSVVVGICWLCGLLFYLFVLSCQ